MNNNRGGGYGQKKFDTPCSTKTPKKFTHTKTPYYTPRETSDSDESTKSSAPSETGTGSYNGDDLSIVAEFDELIRCLKQQCCYDVLDKFIEFAEQTKLMKKHHSVSIQECQRLQMELDKKTHDNRDLENKLGIARKLLDQEKKRYRKIEEERDTLDMKVTRVADYLFKSPRSRVPEEARQDLAFLDTSRQEYNTGFGIAPKYTLPELSAINEVNTTGSLMSDFSYSRSEDDLDTSALQGGKTWKKHKPTTQSTMEPALKKRRSSGNKVIEINSTDTVRATTTLTVAKDGPITATSIIESIPPEPSAPRSPQQQPSAPPKHLIYDLWQRDSPRTMTLDPQRLHTFQTRTLVMPEPCSFCEKRIRFAKSAYKCKDCRAICHPECKDKLPLPCVPVVNTPTQRNMLGVIGDYTPAVPPMVPALIMHCVNEIEMRGLHEVGLYRVPGSEREVKALKERFLKGKGAPCLNQVDIHVMCGTVKDFLRSLYEPLVTYGKWKDFVHAVEAKDNMDVAPALYQNISELPRPNRDTLAYMMIHLKRVAESPECKMPIKNLAKVFGPTIVGYSTADPTPSSLINETKQQCAVMEHLINLPTNYWGSFVNCTDNIKTPTNRLQQTPSTDSLLCATAPRTIFTPYSSRTTTKKKEKLFPRSPAYK